MILSSSICLRLLLKNSSIFSRTAPLHTVLALQGRSLAQIRGGGGGGAVPPEQVPGGNSSVNFVDN